MTHPDFAGIDPLRLPEVRRRIAALDAYLALPAPTTADAVRSGQAIGLSRWQFQRLAAVWRDHRNPSLIVARRQGKRKRDYGITRRAIELANDVIARAGPVEAITAISKEIEARCADAGVAAPSRPTIWSYVRKARAEAPASGPPRIVIGRIWFHLPVKGQVIGTMPTLLAAVLLPERIVVAHRISTDPSEPPSVAELIAEIGALQVHGASPREIVIDVDDRRAAEHALKEAGLTAVPGQRQSAQRDLSRSLGGRFGSLEAIYRRSKARPATRKPAIRFEEPIDSTEVVDAIEAAIASNNSLHPGPRPDFEIAPA